MEKPLAASLEVAEDLALAARQSPRPTMIGFNYRFHPRLPELRTAIAAGKIGRPVAARLRFCTPAAQVPDWKRSLDEGGGALLDAAGEIVAESAGASACLAAWVRARAFFCAGAGRLSGRGSDGDKVPSRF
jgi:hypothetical protein